MTLNGSRCSSKLLTDGERTDSVRVIVVVRERCGLQQVGVPEMNEHEVFKQQIMVHGGIATHQGGEQRHMNVISVCPTGGCTRWFAKCPILGQVDLQR